MLALLPVFTAILIGYLLVRLVRPASGLGPVWVVAAVELSLGAGLGIGLTSALFFILAVSGAASRAAILSLDAATIVLLGALVFPRRGRAPKAAQPAESAGKQVFAWNWALALMLMAALWLVVSAMLGMAESSPHGLWDAFAIWNLRAKFLAGPGQAWKNAVSPLLEKTHPDYPLLLSGFVARCWKVAGNYDPIVPILTALLFFLATVALLVSSLTLLRSLSAGLLGGLVLLTGAAYVSQPMAQYADVPLAFYFLLALVLVFLAWFSDELRRRRLLPLAGLGAALAGWTKNEGLLFLLVFCGCYGSAEWLFSGLKKAVSRTSWLLLGVLPGLLLTGWLKLLVAPEADSVMRHAVKGASHGIADFHRVAWVVREVFGRGADFGHGMTHPLVLLVVLCLTLRFSVPQRNRGPVLFGAGTLAFVFGGYCVVSLVVFTPFERFYSQLWPAFLFVAFMALRPVEETLILTAAKEAAPGPRGGKKRKKKERF